MDSTSVTSTVQKEWSVWNVRGFMILSLFLQLFLAIVAPLRQKTSNRFIKFVVWSSYLLADWSAMFVFSLISNDGCGNSKNNDLKVPPEVMAFWAAFLLIHLGGPDTITTFSLEGDVPWPRQLVSLVAQVSVFMYIFVKTLPNNRLLVPTVLIFTAGVINFGERTRALYLATLENLKETIVETTVMERFSYDIFYHIRFSHDIFYHIAKGLACDIMPDLQECIKCRDCTLDFSVAEIYCGIISSLNFLYEHLYTKAKGWASRWGILARGISYHSTQAAFILFCLADKHGFRGVDLTITYSLFVGVFILHVSNTMLITNDLRIFTPKEVILLALGQGIFPVLLAIALVFVMIIILPDSALNYIFNRTWSEKMGSLNMLSQCFIQCVPRRGRKLGFIWNKLVGETYASREHIDILLWDHVCKDIKGKAAGPFAAARMRELYEARGDRALEENDCSKLMTYIRDFEYENTLLIWHIATEICFHIEAEIIDGDERKMKRIFSKKLSDYMMYLLVKQPKLMPAVAGISHIRYEDTCDELKLLGRESGALNMQKFCESILEKHANIVEPAIGENNHSIIIDPAMEENNHMQSVLKDSCRLVRLLRENNNKWEVIFEVWLEMLSYAAGHSRVESHLRLLSEGSEFLTVVWMLMAFCGIRDQFPVQRSAKEDDNEEIGKSSTDLTKGEEDIRQEIVEQHDVPTTGEATKVDVCGHQSSQPFSVNM